MKLPKYLTRALAVLAVLAVSIVPTISSAALVDFNFSFANTANGGGLVSGIIRGLSDTGSSAATSVEVLSNTGGFGVGEYIGVPNDNTFTVVSGAITAFDFLSFGIHNSAPDVTCCTLKLTWETGGPQVGLTEFPGSVKSFANTGLKFTSVSAVPLPASALLLVSGFAGLVGVGKRRRNRNV